MLCEARALQPDVCSGCGMADLRQGLTVSWIPGGDEAITAYRLELWSAGEETLLYSTGDVSLPEPVLPVDALGNARRVQMRISAAALTGAGVVNGQDYRLVLTQITASDRLTNRLPAFFHARRAPTLALRALPPVVTGHSAAFTAVYAQPEGDGLQQVRWTLAAPGGEEEPIRDTLWLPAAGEAQFSFAGFAHGQSYALRCRARSQLGAEADTGWQRFDCRWAIPPREAGSEEAASPSARPLSGGGIAVHWPDPGPCAALLVLRQHTGEAYLRTAARLSPSCAGFTDLAVPGGTEVRYVVLALGRQDRPLSARCTAAVTAGGRDWQLIQARETAADTYQPVQQFRFACGFGGVRPGRFSNLSSPALQKNFTPFPLLQPGCTNALSGTLTALAGLTISDLQQRSLTQPLPDAASALCALSTTQDALFLRDPRGRLLPVALSGPVSFEEDAKSAALPQTVSLPWQQCGTADTLSLYSPGPPERTPADGILFGTLQFNASSGRLTLSLPDELPATRLQLRQDGVLCAVPDAEASYTPARLTLENGRLIARWEPEGGE